MGVQLRTGDKAILALAGGIVAYEYLVADDADLISQRVAAYRRAAPLLIDTLIIATALHLMDGLPARLDVYQHLMRWFRSPVPAPPNPYPGRD